MSTKHKTRIIVDGVELTVVQDGDSVTISRVVGRDRVRKLDMTGGTTFNLTKEIDPPALALVDKLKRVAKYQTAPCRCDYRYGYSDHAEHCQSIYVAEYDGACVDDD